MAVAPTIFMKLMAGGAVVGDVTVPGFEKQIGVDSFDWSAEAVHRAVGGPVPLSNWSKGKLKVTKVFDRSSTALYGCMSPLRKKVDSCLLTMLDTSVPYETLQKMLEFQVYDCYIEEISTKASDAGKAMSVSETIELSFVWGKLTYHPAHPTRPGRDAPTHFEMKKPA